ncbi:uncharacterized protein DSM5745_03904 [Aspergillus mulundensis]|uniref:EKC/KEOPS complex subunit BUD32 n=1 Tax=Aspergillus mulundensis TaxID=1810919 RepID=A0A3D8SCT2_9EURO|nr:hypothetical protein DSM5745_03904 [Aspergillus mulundensis]RDW83578.1 hypothetical protein DSM5745_03904 [Aspergillus mulundensis]
MCTMEPMIPLKRKDGVGTGNRSIVHRVTPTIVVKRVCDKGFWEGIPEESYDNGEHPFARELAFYKALNSRQDRCPEIVACFLALPDYFFLSYCELNRLDLRYFERQEREVRPSGLHGRLIRVTGYEDIGLVARWVIQVTSALAYVEKMGFCHNDIAPRNCLLDRHLNLRLCDFDRATTFGQPVEGVVGPWARKLIAGPLKGSYGLCSARTEQFATGTLVYYMVYGCEPYEDELGPTEYDSLREVGRRFSRLEFPDLNRNAVLDKFISSCWHEVFPNMALTAYYIKRAAKDIALEPHVEEVDCGKGRRDCERLIRDGLLGSELALSFQPAWRRYLHFFVAGARAVWERLVCLLGRSCRMAVADHPPSSPPSQPSQQSDDTPPS